MHNPSEKELTNQPFLRRAVEAVVKVLKIETSTGMSGARVGNITAELVKGGRRPVISLQQELSFTHRPIKMELLKMFPVSA